MKLNTTVKENKSQGYEVMNICSKCVLSSNYPTIKFNKNNECSFCANWQKRWGDIDFTKTSAQLKAILEPYRGKVKPNDCVVGFSGGKDSNYAVFNLKKMGFNPLCVTMDNGFLSQEARTNIQRLTDKFSLGHRFISPDRDILFKFYRHFLLTTGEFCSVCNTAIRFAIRQAIKISGVKLAVVGSSPRTEANVPEEFFCCTDSYFKNVAKLEFRENEVGSFDLLSYKDRIIKYFRKKDRVLYLRISDFVPWKEEEIVEELRKADVHLSLWSQHTDCVMSDAKEYLKLKQFGMLEKAAKLSSLIRDGQIDRGKALELLGLETERILNNERDIREKIKEVFEINEEQLDTVTKLKPGPYLPKGEAVFKVMKSILSFFGKHRA
ncbi:MAG: hypothetical protein WCY12_04030 [Candidatus Omnitrophota bacterium]